MITRTKTTKHAPRIELGACTLRSDHPVCDMSTSAPGDTEVGATVDRHMLPVQLAGVDVVVVKFVSGRADLRVEVMVAMVVLIAEDAVMAVDGLVAAGVLGASVASWTTCSPKAL